MFRTRGADIVAALVGFVPIVALGLDDGGFYSRSWTLGTLAFTAVAIVALLTRRPALGWIQVAFVLALALFAAWTLLSETWGISGTAAADEARRALLYVAAAGAFVLVVDRRSAPALLAGVFAGITTVCAYGLVDRAVSSEPPDRFQGTLLAEPIGYANALGILAAIGVILGVGFVWHAGDPARRALIGAATAVVGLALLLTESRGAWLAAGCGLAVLLVGEVRRPAGRVRWIALASAALLAVVLVVLVSPSLGHRPHYWRAALSDARDYPQLGSGAGSFDDYWLEHRGLEVEVRDAHSLYLESLAELGPVGLALVLLALSLPLVGAIRARGGAVTSAALGGYVAFLVHAGLDWDWEVPVVTIAAIACATALLGARD